MFEILHEKKPFIIEEIPNTHWEKKTGHGGSFYRVISLPPFWLWDKSQITRSDKSKFTRLLLLKLIMYESNEYSKR